MSELSREELAIEKLIAKTQSGRLTWVASKRNSRQITDESFFFGLSTTVTTDGFNSEPFTLERHFYTSKLAGYGTSLNYKLLVFSTGLERNVEFSTSKSLARLWTIIEHNLAGVDDIINTFLEQD